MNKIAGNKRDDVKKFKFHCMIYSASPIFTFKSISVQHQGTRDMNSISNSKKDVFHLLQCVSSHDSNCNYLILRMDINISQYEHEQSSCNNAFCMIVFTSNETYMPQETTNNVDQREAPFISYTIISFNYRHMKTEDQTQEFNYNRLATSSESWLYFNLEKSPYEYASSRQPYYVHQSPPNLQDFLLQSKTIYNALS